MYISFPMPPMELLMKLGVVGATPFVVQFLLDELTYKHLVAMGVGVVLSFVIAFNNAALPVDFMTWAQLIMTGLADGAIASAGVAMAFKVSDKVGGLRAPSKVE